MSFSPSVFCIKNANLAHDVPVRDETVPVRDEIVRDETVSVRDEIVRDETVDVIVPVRDETVPVRDETVRDVLFHDVSVRHTEYDDSVYKKYMSKLPEDKQNYITSKRNKYFFSNLPRNISSKIQMDVQAAYSVTEMDLANQTSKYILTLISKRGFLTITDATACIGGNTISFSNYFAYVNSVEIDPTRAEFLRNNLKLLCPDCNVKIFVANYNDEYIQERLKQDVVFIDPPWGSNYFEKETLSLSLSNKPLVEVCRDLLGKTSLIVIKVPYNFDFETFQKRGSEGGVLSNFDKKEIGKRRKNNGNQMPKFVIFSMKVVSK